MKKYLRLAMFSMLIVGVQLIQFCLQFFNDDVPNVSVVRAEVPPPYQPPIDYGSNCADAGSDGGSGGGGGGGADGGGCFPAGTLVSTPNGKKAIETIQVGDMVYGFDSQTGEVTISSVMETMKHSWEEMGETSPLIIVTHKKGVITLTTNHPVYMKGSTSKEGFIDFENAGMLKTGDVLTMESGEESTITEVLSGPQYDYVYNIEVDKVHTYNAEGVRVHNKE